MEEDLYKNLKIKGFTCVCECQFHQIKKLGINEINIPDLKTKKRIGVIKRLAVKDKKIEDKKIKPIERLVVVLEKSEKIINSLEEIEKNLDIIKFIQGEDEELNEYRKKVVSLGIKNKTIYILLNTSSTGKSAGVSLLISFYSAYYGIGIPNNFSATGEVNTEDGTIKGIGGLKEKFLCAIRNKNIDNLVLPQENYEEVLEISSAYSKRFIGVSKKLKFYPASH
ncbi:7902_t:CDS:2 [Racocetra fulgida]|uniref:7902_t:CDS:1 n=1 Tax=Racocetra fulgida TaxID=60492 RepID=A0A9N8VET4_9GLOM|nr:7902_t:CDS:2 [Racocetra fulgida]